MTHRNPGRRPDRTARSSGPGGAARSGSSARRGPSGPGGRSERPRTRADAARSSDGPTSRLPKLSVGGPAAPAARAGLLRQTLALGLALAIVAVAVAGPLRSYIARQSDLAAAQQQIERLQAQKAALEERKRALSDPDYVAAEARRRLQYVSPGQTQYRVVTKPVSPAKSSAGAEATSGAAQPATPWYGKLWDTVSADVQPGG